MTPQAFFPSFPSQIFFLVSFSYWSALHKPSGWRSEGSGSSIVFPAGDKDSSALSITRLLLHAATCPLSPANLLDIDAIKKGHSRSGWLDWNICSVWLPWRPRGRRWRLRLPAGSWRSRLICRSWKYQWQKHKAKQNTPTVWLIKCYRTLFFGFAQKMWQRQFWLI